MKQASLDGGASWSSWKSATSSSAALTEGNAQSDGSANWAGDSSILTGGVAWTKLPIGTYKVQRSF